MQSDLSARTCIVTAILQSFHSLYIRMKGEDAAAKESRFRALATYKPRRISIERSFREA